jgi:glycerol kinase
MSEKDLLLAIDNGTQSLKALIFDLEGQLIAKEMVAFKPYFSEHPAWAEQEPEIFWQALCQACQRLLSKQYIARDRIAGVALTTQRGTVSPAIVSPVWRSPHNGAPLSTWIKTVDRFARPCFGSINAKPTDRHRSADLGD